MAFADVVDPFHIGIGLFHRIAKLGAMHHRDPHIVFAIGHQERAFDLGSAQQRRIRLHHRLVLDRVADQHRHAELQRHVLGIAPVDGVKHLDVGDANPVDAAFIKLMLADQAHQRRIAAIAGTGDADALGVSQTLLDRPMGRIGHIILHLLAPALPAGLEMLEAIAHAAAVFGLDHQIAARSQQLCAGLPGPMVAAHIRAAMHQHHRRPGPFGRLFGQGDLHRNVQAVARGKLLHIASGHLPRVDPGLGAGHQRQGLGITVVEVKSRG